MNFKYVILSLSVTLLFMSCDKTLKHQRYVKNNSQDTITIFNPDFKDTTYTVFPGQQALIYEFENLDTKQEKEPCRWLGDTLIIKTINDSICTKATSFEGNWISKMGGNDKQRSQTCTFTVEAEDF